MNYYSVFICFQEIAHSLKAQLDQQKDVVDYLVFTLIHRQGNFILPALLASLTVE